MDEDSGGRGDAAGAGKWYELFSRGARDWLRHDEKVREAVRANLPEIIAGGEVMNEGARTLTYLVADARAGEVSGEYFADCRPARVSPQAADERLARALWQESERLTAAPA